MLSFKENDLPYNLEIISSLPDADIAGKFLNGDQEFAEYISGLMLEIYRDDTLREVRKALMEETISRPNHLEKSGPIADERVRTLARVRQVVVKSSPKYAGNSLYCGSTEQHNLQRWLELSHDGDLAYRYTDDNYKGSEDTPRFAGIHAAKAMFNWGLHFSPELQMKALTALTKETPAQVDMYLVEIAAQRGRLTFEAWVQLLSIDSRSTFYSILYTIDQRPEVLGLIQSNPKHALLYRARTDEASQEELLDSANEYGDFSVRGWLANCQTLASERVALALAKSDDVDYIIARNEPVLERFPSVRQVLESKKV